MSISHTRILAVDDDDLMRQILIEYLEETEYEVVTAANGADAWDRIQKEGSSFHTILLDRMMPVMDGMEVMTRMQRDQTLQHIPVIMQTAAASSQQLREGIEAGVYYYLTKPFEKDVLLAIVESAVRKAKLHQEAQQEIQAQAVSLTNLETGQFRFQTLDEAHGLAVFLATACPDPTRVVMGLTDLLANAVEHGNLGISYDEKTALHETNQWEEEIHRRFTLPENADKWVNVSFERFPFEVRITITDQGKGFDWKQYMEMDPTRACSSHGRGIVMAKALCFDNLEYRGTGNEVVCTVHGSGVQGSTVPLSLTLNP